MSRFGNDKPSRVNLREKPKKKKSGFFKKTFKVFIYISLVVLLIVLGGLLFGYLKYGDMVINSYKNAQNKIEYLDEDLFKSKGKTVIYDDNGNVLKELSSADYYYVEANDIPKHVKYAAIAIEDERFLEHSGVDYKSLVRAVVALAKNNGEITQGGSTITQQLVKNTLLTHEQTYSRKIEEIFIARELEKSYSKEKILEYYLNNVYFGNGAYGIATAAKTYFSKDISEITVPEAALLISITNNPSLYNPVTNMDNAIKRQQRVLKKMVENEFITTKEYEQYILEEIQLNIYERVVEKEDYATSFAIADATKKLMQFEGFEFKYKFENDDERKTYEADYNEKFQEANQKIRSGGFIIHTSLDMDMQKNAQEIVNKHLSGSSNAIDKESGLYKRQATNVIIENETGYVKTIIGGRTQDDVANTYNRAYLSYRQPGSTMKPIAVYTQAFENGLLPTDVMKDEPIKNGPSNWNGKYHGNTTITKAVINSWNTIPYRLIIKNGIDNSIKDLTELGFTKIVDADRQAGLAIGGMTYGATTLEMAGAYSTLARNGAYIDSTAIKEMTYLTSEVIYKHAPGNQKQVYDIAASYLMTTVLEEVAKNGYRNSKFNGTVKGFATATKTGSTNEYKDIWFAGYTPVYTSVVWVGEDTPAPLKEYAYDTPLEIWNETMNYVHKYENEQSEFKVPTDFIEKVYYNSRTGDVSETAKSGYVYQWIPTSYIVEYKEKKRLNQIESAKAREESEKERKIREQEEAKLEELRQKELAEKERLEKERAERERKELDDWLIAQGSSLSEEESKLSRVKSLLSSLNNYQVTSSSQFKDAENRLKEVENAISGLLVSDNKKEMNVELENEKSRINKQKEMVKSNESEKEKERLQKEKEEQERLEREKAEQERLEKEKEEQESLTNPTENNSDVNNQTEIINNEGTESNSTIINE